MEHWSEKYIGRPWTQEQDCFYFLKEVQEKEFGRDVLVDISYFQMAKNPTASIVRLLSNERPPDAEHWQEVDEAKDGDVVFLTQRTVAHHVGIAAFVDSRMEILHSLEGLGVVRSSLLSLRTNSWKIARILSWK